MQQEHVVVHSMTSMCLNGHTQMEALVDGFCEDVAVWMCVRWN